MSQQIATIHQQSRQTYGARIIGATLKAREFQVWSASGRSTDDLTEHLRVLQLDLSGGERSTSLAVREADSGLMRSSPQPSVYLAKRCRNQVMRHK